MQAPCFLFRWVFILIMAAGAVVGVGGRAMAEADAKVTMELIKFVTPRESYQATFEQVAKQMLASMRQAGRQVPPDVESKLVQAMTEVLPYDKMTNWAVEVYAPRFTTEEITQLIAFYKTPIGTKLAKLQPEISGEVGKKVGAVMVQRLPEAMKKVGLTP